MRVSVHQVDVGDRLLYDVFNAYGLPLISAGTQLHKSDIEKLNAHNVDYVDIVPRSEDDDWPPRYDEEKLEVYHSAIGGVKQLFESVRKEGQLNEEEVNRTFDPLVDRFHEDKDVVSMLLVLNSKDDYTYQHSVQVGMLSYYIAKWSGLSEKQAVHAGKAGYLHDIGKSMIDNAILQKPGKLTDEEYDEIKKHTIYGHDILRRSFDDPSLALVAMQHHERLDGQGYPNGLTGEQIHPLAKIVAIADVYSAMICTRVYQKKRDLLAVLRELHRMSFGELDPAAVQAFVKHMIPNFIRKKVALTDGRTGTIVMMNPLDVFRPLILIDGHFIDLSCETGLEIEFISV
ncbi:HD family phosphohydrolase [Gordoniibacillus kamchatkensis]|uniref:HD family phosphohydrolase n=1 Tax=Gordoniibacillus kamchatkensis TaxID=1590651 RepID=A0ABR5AN08_9BACL|nr:HD-GYP domain-containing protein [Paenibacillus sp. VKM B-2647]KIL42406.1 HD family phosphohydrolase [Paenibacillus sp. VKM B-2647]